MANKINHLIDAYQRLTQKAENCVLATIIETFGSTYQKAGARMLITTEGELIGLLGGGCFERDLIEQALAVFETGAPKTVFYDMRSSDDIIWGLGLGCNGAVRVFLQLLKAEEHFAPLNTLIDAAENNAQSIMVTVVESEYNDFPAGYSLFVPTTTTNNRELLSTAPFPFTSAALQTIEKQKPHIETHVINSQTIKAFYEPIHPPLRLLILGAGADAIPLTQFARLLGWRITIVDHRPGYIIKDRFPRVDQLLYRTPETLHDDLDINQFNALIVMTHNIEYDQRYLKALAHCDIPFIGLLGPVHRKIKLLQSLGNDASKISSRVFGPVGLDIGAETPEEIALSIVAGIHAELNKRNGQQLNSDHYGHLSDYVQR